MEDGVIGAYDKQSRDLGKLGDVFGDPTRRGIYRHLRQAGEPLSSSEVAEVFGLHRTVARAHLEKLVQLGLVESGTRRRPGGGRPAKTYVISAERLEVMLPPRRYERLARLLLRLVEENMATDDVQAAALGLGREYGRELTRRVSGDEPATALDPEAVLRWLDAAGYDVTLDDSVPGVVAVNVHNCVYRELAREHPDVVCFFDRGMLLGMLGADESQHRQPLALARGDEYCRHEFRL